MANYTKQMQQLVESYRREGGTWPASTREMAVWAIESGRWDMPTSAVVKKCAEDLADAMREEYLIDAKGRHVRRLHPAKTKVSGEQITIWDDILTAPRSHMQLSFGQRRRSIVGDCKQLKIDVDSYNDGHVKEAPIEVDWDFTMDLLEIEAANDVEGEDEAA
jgi:hypothetical protein